LSGQLVQTGNFQKQNTGITTLSGQHRIFCYKYAAPSSSDDTCVDEEMPALVDVADLDLDGDFDMEE